jgi:hypothetical protein
LESLEVLRLSKTKVTNEGLRTISALRSLTRLKIDRNMQIADEGLKHLAKLKNLEELDVSYTNVTAEGIETLQNALPDCKIIHESISKSVDLDRAVAEWVRSRNGGLLLKVEETSTDVALSQTRQGELPQKEFRIVTPDYSPARS